MAKKIIKEEVVVKEESKKTPAKVVATVVYNGGGASREYSLAVHGENFLELAKSFASKLADSQIV